MVSFFCVYKDCTGLMVGIEEDSVRYAHSGPSQRFLRGFRPLVSVGALPLPMSRPLKKVLTIYVSENRIDE